MLDLFNQTDYAIQRQIHLPQFDVVRATYRRQLEMIQAYYHSRVYAVRNTHLLVRFLQHIEVPPQYSSERFVEATRARAPYVAKAFRFTSDTQPGAIHAGVFYGPESREVLFYEDNYFDIYLAEKQWQYINAVKVLLHPKSDLQLLLPNGRQSSTGEGFSFISIDVPLLALQYRCFLLSQQNQTESQLSTSHFVHQYVLPNMLLRQTDLAVINRVFNLITGRPMGAGLLKHPFNVIDYSHRLDKIIKIYIDYYQDTNSKYEWMLHSLPMIYSADGFDALQIPDYAPTRQCWWAVVLSRLGIIRDLIDFGGHRGILANRDHIVKFKRVLTRLRYENVYPSVLAPDDLYDVQNTIDSILDL